MSGTNQQATGYELWTFEEDKATAAARIEFFGRYETVMDAWEGATEHALDLASVRVCDRRGREYPAPSGSWAAIALAAVS